LEGYFESLAPQGFQNNLFFRSGTKKWGLASPLGDANLPSRVLDPTQETLVALKCPLRIIGLDPIQEILVALKCPLRIYWFRPDPRDSGGTKVPTTNYWQRF